MGATRMSEARKTISMDSALLFFAQQTIHFLIKLLVTVKKGPFTAIDDVLLDGHTKMKLLGVPQNQN